MGMAEIAVVLWTRHLAHNPAESALAGPRPLRAVERARLDAAVRAAAPVRLRPAARRAEALPPAALEDAGAPRVRRDARASRRPPGRSGRASPTRSAWRWPRSCSPRSSTGPATASSTTAPTCFVGDGCLMEGISHEAASLAGTLGLDKLVVLYDDNGISIDGEVEGWFTDDTPKRFEAYGWHVIRDVDGHDVEAVDAALADARDGRRQADADLLQDDHRQGLAEQGRAPRRPRRRAGRGRGRGDARSARLALSRRSRFRPTSTPAGTRGRAARSAQARLERDASPPTRRPTPPSAAEFRRRIAGRAAGRLRRRRARR